MADNIDLLIGVISPGSMLYENRNFPINNSAVSPRPGLFSWYIELKIYHHQPLSWYAIILGKPIKNTFVSNKNRLMWTGYLLSPVFPKLMVQLSVLRKKTNTNLIFISKDILLDNIIKSAEVRILYLQLARKMSVFVWLQNQKRASFYLFKMTQSDQSWLDCSVLTLNCDRVSAPVQSLDRKDDWIS